MGIFAAAFCRAALGLFLPLLAGGALAVSIIPPGSTVEDKANEKAEKAITAQDAVHAVQRSLLKASKRTLDQWLSADATDAKASGFAQIISHHAAQAKAKHDAELGERAEGGGWACESAVAVEVRDGFAASARDRRAAERATFTGYLAPAVGLPCGEAMNVRAQALRALAASGGQGELALGGAMAGRLMAKTAGLMAGAHWVTDNCGPGTGGERGGVDVRRRALFVALSGEIMLAVSEEMMAGTSIESEWFDEVVGQGIGPAPERGRLLVALLGMQSDLRELRGALRLEVGLAAHLAQLVGDVR